jgi:hypothetical protein
MLPMRWELRSWKTLEKASSIGKMISGGWSLLKDSLGKQAVASCSLSRLLKRHHLCQAAAAVPLQPLLIVVDWKIC